ncbi:MAG: hypothetical protein FWE03_06980 [Firmicutes bacterium]|nr:hypothetical protein [Bacillota bacterium]
MENNWTIMQTKNLFKEVAIANQKGLGLKAAFTMAAENTNKSINSVRNYYYAQLKMFELVPSLAKDLGIEILKSKRDGFELFSEQEIDDLIKNILIGKGEGKSVRSVIAAQAKDAKEALRLQNKYRSMIAHNKTRVNNIMNLLAKEGKIYYNPYFRQIINGEEKVDNLAKLSEYLSKLEPNEVGSFLNILGKLSL